MVSSHYYLGVALSFHVTSQIIYDPLVFVTLIAALWSMLKDVIGPHAKRKKEYQVKLHQMVDDWVGEPARPGFGSVPGVAERVQHLESDVSLIKHEVQFNSGTSIKDAVTRTDATVAELKPQVAELRHKVDVQLIRQQEVKDHLEEFNATGRPV
jgi:hypothetical protein